MTNQVFDIDGDAAPRAGGGTKATSLATLFKARGRSRARKDPREGLKELIPQLQRTPGAVVSEDYVTSVFFIAFYQGQLNIGGYRDEMSLGYVLLRHSHFESNIDDKGVHDHGGFNIELVARALWDQGIVENFSDDGCERLSKKGSAITGLSPKELRSRMYPHEKLSGAK